MSFLSLHIEFILEKFEIYSCTVNPSGFCGRNKSKRVPVGELLHSLAQVDNLEIGSWCIKYMSTLALEGWQSQPSSGRFLKINTNLKELDFPGICSFLKNSSHLQTLVIDWYNPDLKLRLPFHITDRESRRFETHKFDCPLLHLKTIKFINLVGPLSENKFVLPLVKYFLENAIVLEKFEIAGRCRGSAMSQVHVKIEQELLRFSRSSPHASIVFSYQSPPDLD
ncbi:hypothetical protein HAX54_000336 [Datura stramonium]|uniref:FBD domain-containing protein n=1 Tax=Datura stramonium TaxID=4076 RepID=A0ABS8T0W6_DATST|nr:hypothetical protein [Datura stramonium]